MTQRDNDLDAILEVLMFDFVPEFKAIAKNAYGSENLTKKTLKDALTKLELEDWIFDKYLDKLEKDGLIETDNNGFVSITNSGENFKIKEGGPVSIVAVDSNGCSSEKEIIIVSHPLPEVITSDMIDTTFSVGLELNVEYNVPNLTYIWTPSTNLSCNDCAYPEVLKKENNTYIIEVINEYGCRDRALIRLSFKKSNLYLPNILSKNSTTNNVFYAQGNTNEKYNIEIFDRWGNKVFGKENAEVGNVQDGWQPNESLSQGVYVYLITYLDKGEKKVVFGDLTLIE